MHAGKQSFKKWIRGKMNLPTRRRICRFNRQLLQLKSKLSKLFFFSCLFCFKRKSCLPNHDFLTLLSTMKLVVPDGIWLNHLPKFGFWIHFLKDRSHCLRTDKHLMNFHWKLNLSFVTIALSVLPFIKAKNVHFRFKGWPVIVWIWNLLNYAEYNWNKL